MSAILHVVVAATADGDNTVVAAVTGKKIIVVAYQFGHTSTGIVTWRSGAAGTIHMTATAAAAGSYTFAGSRDVPAWIGDLSAALVCNVAAGTDCIGRVSYYLQ